MAANEDYLDSLLKAAMDSEKKDEPADELLSQFNSIEDLDTGLDLGQGDDSASDSASQISDSDKQAVDFMEEMPDIDKTENDFTIESVDSTKQEDDESKVTGGHNEMEFDLNSLDDIDELLGLRERPQDHKEDLINENPNPDQNQVAEETEIPEENTSDPVDLESQDLSDLLDLLGGDDDELAEINDILKKSDNHEIVDKDSIQDMENALSTDAATAEQKDDENTDKAETKKKKKKKLFGRKKKNGDTLGDASDGSDQIPGGIEAGEDVPVADPSEKNAVEATGESNVSDFDSMPDMSDIFDSDAIAEITDKPDPDGSGNKKDKKDKPGFFKKLIQVLTEEIEDDPETEEEAGKKKEKKSKKDKKKKTPETNEELLEEMAEEDSKAAKGKKKKKPKKEKKKKEKIKIEDADAQNEKKLPKKMVVRIFVLGFSIMAVVLILAAFTPKIISLQQAHSYFYKGDYKNAYKELTAQKSLGKSDTVLLEKARLLTELENKNSLYQAYCAAGMEIDSVNALLEGVGCYQADIDSYARYGISYEAESLYEQFMAELSGKYGLTQEQVSEILQMDSVAYTYRLREITNTSGDAAMTAPDGTDDTISGNDIQTGDKETETDTDAAYQQDSLADPLADELE